MSILKTELEGQQGEGTFFLFLVMVKMFHLSDTFPVLLHDSTLHQTNLKIFIYYFLSKPTQINYLFL